MFIICAVVALTIIGIIGHKADKAEEALDASIDRLGLSVDRIIKERTDLKAERDALIEENTKLRVALHAQPFTVRVRKSRTLTRHKRLLQELHRRDEGRSKL